MPGAFGQWCDGVHKLDILRHGKRQANNWSFGKVDHARNSVQIETTVTRYNTSTVW